MGHLPDPLYPLIPLDQRWFVISVDMYTWLTVGITLALFAQAYLGDHRPILRWGVALAAVGLLRGLTILMVPICRANVPEGTCVLQSVPYADLGVVSIPWRMWASNDLLFSGHVSEFFLFLRATRSWPRSARMAIWAYQIAQCYALLATRGHYTIDLILAIPCAYFADRMALKYMRWMARRSEPAQERLPDAVPAKEQATASWSR